jgi:hypothetical protein
VGRWSFGAATSLQWLSERGRGSLFQNRETKGTLPSDQLQVMGEAGGGLPGNSRARPNMGMTDVTAPSAFAAPLFAWSFPVSLRFLILKETPAALIFIAR